MRDELEEDDESLDREWANRLLLKVERNLYDMADAQVQYEERVANFWERIQADQRLADQPVPEDPPPTEVLCAMVARLNDFLEAEMPESLLAEDTAMLDIDQQEESAWWGANDAVEVINLRELVSRSVLRAPNAWEPLYSALIDVLLEALCTGTLPLTGFRAGDCTEGVQRWQWSSPEATGS